MAEASELRNASITRAPPASLAASRTLSAVMDVILVIKGCINSWKIKCTTLKNGINNYKIITTSSMNIWIIIALFSFLNILTKIGEHGKFDDHAQKIP